MKFKMLRIYTVLCVRHGNELISKYCFIVATLICITFISSCTKDPLCNCLKSTGSTVTETRSLAFFNQLEVGKNVELLIVQDSVYFAKVTCGKNLMDGIEITIVNNKLNITNNNRCNWTRSYANDFVVELHCPDLVDIRYSSSGNLTMLNHFKTDSLYLESGLGTGSVILDLDVRVLYAVLNTSVADLTIKGKVEVSYLFANAQGFIEAREVQNYYTYMRSNSTNDCRIKCSGHLDAEIEGQGDIYYYGNPPDVYLKKTGTGSLIKGD